MTLDRDIKIIEAILFASGESVSEDDLKWAGNRLDEMIHGFEAEIESARQVKENELLEI